MSGDIREFIEEQKRQILEEKRRLGVLKKCDPEHNVFREHEDGQQENLKPAEENKENQVSVEDVKKRQKNWVANALVERKNFHGKQGNTRENQCNEVKRCENTTNDKEDVTDKRCRDNEPNCADNKLFKNINNSKRVQTHKANEVLNNYIDNKINLLNNENCQNSVKHSENFINCDSDLRLDLQQITEESKESSFEEEDKIIFKKDAYLGRHASHGPLAVPTAGGASMDHAHPTQPRSILRRGEYSYHYGSGGAGAAVSNASLTNRSLTRAEPHCGLGEYELSRALFAEKRRRDYLRHLAKQNETQKSLELKEDKVTLTESETRLLDKILETTDSNTIKSPEKGLESAVAKIPEKSVENHLESPGPKSDKSVQTDIENIQSKLVQYELLSKDSPERELIPRTVTDDLVDLAYRKRPYRRVDQRLTSAQNELLLSGSSVSKTGRMDKPKSILSNRRTGGSPRSRYGATNSYDDYDPGYTPSSFMDGFSYSDRSDELERERLKRENYQHELRLQIEEKRRLQDMRAEQERRERELENKRLEQQILRIREEAAMEDSNMARRNELMRRHSDDLMRRKHELQLERRPWRRHADSESGALDTLGLGPSGVTSHYSPPVSRRVPYSFNVPSTSVFAESSSRYNPSRFESSSYSSILRNRDTSLNRMDSLNSYETSTVPFSHRSRKFDRFDSLSRIDSLTNRLDSMNVRDEGYSSNRLTEVDRRHSATQQDLSLSSRRSPRSRRRNSSSRFDDSLPIPVLKARSPVAKELRNAVPFSSARSSDSLRRLEDRWQIPAVQKTILHTSVSQPESPSGHHSRGSILTQLGSIRSQLQREQLRMDETLRRRGLARARSTDYGGY